MRRQKYVPPSPFRGGRGYADDFKEFARHDDGGPVGRGAEADAAAGAKYRSDNARLSAAENLSNRGDHTSPPISIGQAVLVTVSDGKDMTMSGRLIVSVAQGSHTWALVFAFAGIVLAGSFGYYFWDQNG